jgi:hypothetical protein
VIFFVAKLKKCVRTSFALFTYCPFLYFNQVESKKIIAMFSLGAKYASRFPLTAKTLPFVGIYKLLLK